MGELRLHTLILTFAFQKCPLYLWVFRIASLLLLLSGDETPVIFLIRRNSEEAVELAKIDMPDDLKDRFMEENGNLKGVFTIEGKVKDWIYKQLNNM